MDNALAKHRDQVWTLANSGYLPTPHGRAVVPWRELLDSEVETGLPARDKLIYQFNFRR